MRTFSCVLTVLVLMLALATTASAQSSVDGYEDQGGQIQAQIQDGGGSGGDGSGTAPVTTVAAEPASGGGSLPFTGLDVALLFGAGAVLAAAGLGMRRLTRSPDSA
jgi:hypothetical protein